MQYIIHYKTVHRRFQQWCEREILRDILTQLANTLREDGVIDERESFIDATFAAAQGGGDAVGLTKRGKGVKILAILDADLKHDGVNMIAPHRSTRKLKTQDGRQLGRYQRRWLVERFFAWLQWKRRLLVRWEYYATNFLRFVQLTSIIILLK